MFLLENKNMLRKKLTYEEWMDKYQNRVENLYNIVIKENLKMDFSKFSWFLYICSKKK